MIMKLLNAAQEQLSVRSDAGVVTHSALVVVVPDEFCVGESRPPAFLVDNVTPENLGDASDRLVAAHCGDPMSRNALNIVQLDARLASYTGSSYVLRLKEPLSRANELCLWRFVAAEYLRNPDFDTWHLIGAG
jgi:hypothetical protein